MDETQNQSSIDYQKGKILHLLISQYDLINQSTNKLPEDNETSLRRMQILKDEILKVLELSANEDSQPNLEVYKKIVEQINKIEDINGAGEDLSNEQKEELYQTRTLFDETVTNYIESRESKWIQDNLNDYSKISLNDKLDKIQTQENQDYYINISDNISKIIDTDNMSELLNIKLIHAKEKIFLEQYNIMTKEEKDNLLNPEEQKYYNMQADWHGKILEFKNGNEPLTPEEELDLIVEKSRLKNQGSIMRGENIPETTKEGELNTNERMWETIFLIERQCDINNSNKLFESDEINFRRLKILRDEISKYCEIPKEFREDKCVKNPEYMLEKLERIIELKSSQKPLEQEQEEELTQLQQEFEQSLEESNEIYQNGNYNGIIEERNNQTAEEVLEEIEEEKESLENPINNISGTLENSSKSSLRNLKILQGERQIFLEKYEQLSQEEKEKLISPEDLELMKTELDLYNKIIELKESNEPITPEKEAEIIEKQQEYYMKERENGKEQQQQEIVQLAPEEQPDQEKQASEEPAQEQPAQEQQVLEQPATEQPNPEQPASEEPATEQPAQEQPAQEQPQTNSVSNEEIYNNFQKMIMQSVMTMLSSIPGIDIIMNAFSTNKVLDELLKYGKEHHDEIKAYLEERKNGKEQQQEIVQLAPEEQPEQTEGKTQTDGQQLDMPQNNIPAFQQPEFGIEQPPKSNEEIYKEYNQLLGKSVLNIVGNIPLVGNYLRMNIGMDMLNETAKYAKEHNAELKAYTNEMKQKEQQKQLDEQQKQQTQNLIQTVEKQNKEDDIELS